MAEDIKLSIATAGGDSFEIQVSYVNLPAEFGSLGILRGHAAMLCAVGPGKLRYTGAAQEQGSIMIGSGVATVADNEVLLLVSDIQM